MLPVSLYECDAPDNNDMNFREFYSEDCINQERETDRYQQWNTCHGTS